MRAVTAALAAFFILLCAAPSQAANFQRMFPGETDDPSTDQALVELTRFDNPATPAANDGPMVDDNAEARQNCDFPLLQPPQGCTPAGFTYLGQAYDHDVTFDRNPLPPFDQTQDPTALENFRTAVIDLDTVYSVGDEARDGARFVLGNQGRDVPRRPAQIHPQTGRPFEEAIIGDPRNDENSNIAQIHLATLRLHNSFVDDHPLLERVAPHVAFAAAKAQTINYWQRLFIHDVLPRFVGQEAVDHAVAKAPEYWNPGGGAENIRMPVEFSSACWRMPHSNFRLAYRVAAPNNLTAANIQVFNGTDGVNDLTGGHTIQPARFINWPNFVQFPGQLEPVNSGRRFDTKISRPGFQLPIPAAIPGGSGSLPERNLQRARSYQLPSYEDVARLVGATPVASNLPPGHGDEMPLWYGALLESELAGGRKMGTTCARVVADVFIGALKRTASGRVALAQVRNGQGIQAHQLFTRAGVGPAS